MSNPIFDGLSLPNPTDSKITNVVTKGNNRTLEGATEWDVLGRRYEYELHWAYLTVEDYDDLEEKVNDLTTKLFTWDKYPSSSGGITTLAVLSSRTPKTPGNQDTGFYSDVTLSVREVSTRL